MSAASVKRQRHVKHPSGVSDSTKPTDTAPADKDVDKKLVDDDNKSDKRKKNQKENLPDALVCFCIIIIFT